MLHNVRGKHSLYSQSKRQRREKQTHTPSLGCTAQNTAQHSFPPPKNTLSNSQHCSLSCAAAPEELSVRNCKRGPRHTASCTARASNSQQHQDLKLSLQNNIKYPAYYMVNKKHKAFSWRLHNIQQHNLVLLWALVVKVQ